MSDKQEIKAYSMAELLADSEERDRGFDRSVEPYRHQFSARSELDIQPKHNVVQFQIALPYVGVVMPDGHGLKLADKIREAIIEVLREDEDVIHQDIRSTRYLETELLYDETISAPFAN